MKQLNKQALYMNIQDNPKLRQSIEQANINLEDFSFETDEGRPDEFRAYSVYVTHIQTGKSKPYPLEGASGFSRPMMSNVPEIMDSINAEGEASNWLPEFIKDYKNGYFN